MPEAMSHKIDIIIPCYNYARFLDECLGLIQAQTRGDYRVLVMDNASTDETPEVARRWMARDDRIAYHRNDTNLGAVGNMKLGYELTAAEYVVILPADDMWKPAFLEKVAGALDANPECSYAYAGWHTGDGDLDSPDGPMFHCPHREGGVVDELAYLTIQNHIPLSFGIFRREACERVGGAYPLVLPMLGDLYLWMRLSSAGHGFFVRENLGRLRFHGGNESHALAASGRSAFDHIHLLDLVFQSELWPLSIRLLAKARQMQLMTGRRLADIALGYCSREAPSFIRTFVEPARDEFLSVAARAIEGWIGRGLGLGDTEIDARMLLDQVGGPLRPAAAARARRGAGNDGESDAGAVPPLPLFSRSRPYYIVADDYGRSDSSARVMHQLCHALNLAGAEAYLLAGETTPELRTPTLNLAIEHQHRQAGVAPIIVYPDSVEGDPLDAPSAVRYAWRRRPALPQDAEMCRFAPQPALLPPDRRNEGLLAVPLVDLKKFRPDGPRGNAWVAYVEGYPDARLHFSELLKCCEIVDRYQPATQDGLIELLCRAERFYCFGESELALEAALCGCPVVHIPAPGGALHPAGAFAAVPGSFATDDSDEALDEVRANLYKLRAHYEETLRAFPQQLHGFVAVTQELPVRPRVTGTHEEQPESLVSRWATARIAAPAVSPRRHALWRANRTLQEIDGELMAERMLRKWAVRPRFRLLVEIGDGEEALLADTLDTLDAQLYPDWHLTILAPGPCPDKSLDESCKIRWVPVGGPAERRGELEQLAQGGDADWCAIVAPGLRLEPYTLQMLGDYIAMRPHWRFIYVDEDVVDRTGKLADPRFKPDLNLDLLRSIDYLGGFCTVSASALREAGGPGECRGAESYDIALRLLDRFGARAIGHVAEVLCHSPAASRRPLPIEAERQAVIDHLVRCGVDAVVQDGHGFATRRIIYRHSTSPHVTVVITSRDKAEFLGPCLESLFERTCYPSFDVIVLDPDSREPDARALMDRLNATGELPLRVLPVDPSAGVAAHYNIAAAAAAGEYLLFLDDDCVVLQDDWLARLMASACRPEVGIVGPRFAAPGREKLHDAGLVLGFRGPVGAPYAGILAPDAPGYLGHRTLDQNVSALSPACFIVRAGLLRALGGFAEKDFPHDHTVLDLCLRTNDSGHWIVWTPYVTLARYGNSSREAAPKAASENVERLAQIEGENDRLIRSWLPKLARDPFYNRNLSLLDAYQPEHRATIDWNVDFRDRQRIVGFPLPGGSGEYRVIAPLRAISRGGLAQTSVIHSERRMVRVLSLLELARAEPDVLVMHQAVEPGQIATLDRCRKYLPNMRRVTGLDDLISLLPAKHPGYRRRAVDIRPRLRASLAVCDRVVVSTEPLAELCRPLIDDVVVMPNCLEWDIWGKLEPVYAPCKKPRVGWIGAQQHYGDLEHVFEVVAELANEVDWVFMGMCPEPIRQHVHEFHDWTHGFEAYASKMATLNLELAIAPLDVNPFNEAKSNLRLLEYGAMRWPVVCTDVYPYRNAPVTRVPNTTRAWVDAIREKLSDRDAARREGEALRHWVEENFILEQRAGEWLDAFAKP